ncbi:unnamed protein product [Rotaria sordida]|uniref:F-box domain-containing protein n=1 Tax=Rotaria sordida TaxID=392033 RepID=A0A819EZ19_9BILA|nr:unnamed protein product [Rotaria sordida]
MMDFDDDDDDNVQEYPTMSMTPLEKPNVTWQHQWSPSETQDAVSQSPFSTIPSEIMLYIFQFLSVPDLCNISLVCRSFKMVADQDEIWKLKCTMSKKLYSKPFKQIYMEWIHEKCLRNVKLRYQLGWHTTACIRCLPPLYPIRLTTNSQFEPIGGFDKHPNSSSNMTIELSVDIDKTTRELIKLLEKASEFQDLWEKSSILKQMIRRYYRFMQLKASLPTNILLIPTLDIEIIWQTHLLRPDMYQADCLRLFRRIIDHSLVINDTEQFFKEQAFVDTCQLYEQRFGEHYCCLPSAEKKKETDSDFLYDPYYTNNKMNYSYSYWDKTQFNFFSRAPTDYENPFSFTEADIILDSRWLDMCKQFMFDALNQVDVEHSYYHSSKKIDLSVGAMKRLMKSYERFLYMAAKYPLIDDNGFVPPTYAIDIMWHSHMQEPLKYIADCHRLVGYVIYHAPWPIIEGNTMKKSREKTNQIWKDEFSSGIQTDHLYNTLDQQADWD